MGIRSRLQKQVSSAVAKAEDSARLPIKADSFHYKIYKWYLANGGTSRHSANSLCPYMRIVLLWAPLLFLVGHPFHASRSGVFWTIIFSLLFSLGVVNKGASIWLVITIFAGILTSVSALRLIYVHDPEKFEQNVENFLEWFLVKRYFKVIFPWMIAIAVFLTATYLIWGPNGPLSVVFIILALSALTVAAVMMLVTLFVIKRWVINPIIGTAKRWWQGRTQAHNVKVMAEPGPKQIVSVSPIKFDVIKPKKGPSFLSLIIAYLKAKERKICPYIQLPDQKPRVSINPAPPDADFFRHGWDE